ncbi:MAG: flagellar filament capping protein FliD, partial [Polyangiaceae bacterium]|nr:flagellar filament capping protein FliD [Polyangiaceae bacterium]
TLRTITNSLSNQILSRAGTGGALDSLADLGIRLNNDGTLKVEATELKEALTNHPDSFRMVLAGDNQQDGLMDVLGSLLKGYTDVGTGLLAGRKDALDSSIKLFQAQATRESTRLDRMEERLRASLAVMDAQVAQSNTAMSYLLGG